MLPFENLTGNPSDQYLSDGMTEEIVGQLARVNELMDWCNTGLARELCYGTIYPQIFPNMHRASEEAQAQELNMQTHDAHEGSPERSPPREEGSEQERTET